MPQEKINDGGVTKKVEDAKKALEAAKNNPKVGTKSGHSYIGAPPKISTPAVPEVPKAPSAGLLREAESAGEGIKALAEQTKDIPKMHKGGKVKEDGPKDLQKGETVIPKEGAKEGEKAMKELKKKSKGGAVSEAIKEEENEPKAEEKHETKKAEKAEGKHKTSDKHNPAHEDKKVKHNHARTEIVHHKNGSHTVTHHPHPPKPSTDGSPVEAPEPVSYAAGNMDELHAGLNANLGGGEAGGSPEGAPQA